MAGKTATLAINIYGDSKDAQKALAQVEVSIKQTDTATKKAGKSMGGVWAAVAAGMTACVAASAQLGAATNGLSVIFEDQAGDMLTWAEGMASMGLSTAQAAGAATILGAQLKNAGASTEQMTVITQGLIETAAQLSIVLGGSATEAVMAMGAAIRGEYDSLERYGITLTADAVATEVARLASEGYTFATEQQAKTVATLSLIQQQATAILGEAEGQTVTMSSATDHLKASTKNLAAVVGDLITADGVLVDATATVIDGIVTQASESELLESANALLAQVLTDVADILEPLLSQALSVVSDLMDKLASFIDTYVMPILDALAEVLDKVSQALSVVIGWVQDAIIWFDNFTDSVRDAIDALTFWNDTYDPNADNLQAPATASLAVAGRATVPANVTINVQTLDPYSAGRYITRALDDYNLSQGRKRGQPLAVAW